MAVCFWLFDNVVVVLCCVGWVTWVSVMIVSQTRWQRLRVTVARIS